MLRGGLGRRYGSPLGPAYEQAWADWSESDDSGLWETVAGDGLG